MLSCASINLRVFAVIVVGCEVMLAARKSRPLRTLLQCFDQDLPV